MLVVELVVVSSLSTTSQRYTNLHSSNRQERPSIMSDHQNPVIGSTAGLEEFRIQSLPSAAYYIPDFITKEEEKIILNKVSVHRF